jgi:hypothetical protein
MAQAPISDYSGFHPSLRKGHLFNPEIVMGPDLTIGVGDQERGQVGIRQFNRWKQGEQLTNEELSQARGHVRSVGRYYQTDVAGLSASGNEAGADLAATRAQYVMREEFDLNNAINQGSGKRTGGAPQYKVRGEPMPPPRAPINVAAEIAAEEAANVGKAPKIPFNTMVARGYVSTKVLTADEAERALAQMWGKSEDDFGRTLLYGQLGHAERHPEIKNRFHTLYEGDRPVAMAAVQELKDHDYIAAFSTAPTARGKGYAPYLINEIAEGTPGHNVTLVSASTEMNTVMKKLGWKTTSYGSYAPPDRVAPVLDLTQPSVVQQANQIFQGPRMDPAQVDKAVAASRGIPSSAYDAAATGAEPAPGRWTGSNRPPARNAPSGEAAAWTAETVNPPKQVPHVSSRPARTPVLANAVERLEATNRAAADALGPIGAGTARVGRLSKMSNAVLHSKKGKLGLLAAAAGIVGYELDQRYSNRNADARYAPNA